MEGQEIIEQIINSLGSGEEIKIAQIELFVARKTGFGKKFVLSYLRLLEETDLVKVNDKMVIKY